MRSRTAAGFPYRTRSRARGVDGLAPNTTIGVMASTATFRKGEPAAEPGPEPARLEAWPRLDSPDVAETCTTLHLWSQLLGKTKLALAPPVNHWWHVTLRVSARGLTTTP